MIVKEYTLDGMPVFCNGEQLYTCEFEKGDLLQCAIPSMLIARQLLITASWNWKTQRKIEKMLDEDETVMFRLRVFQPLLPDKKFRRYRKYIRVVFDEYCRRTIAL